MGKGGGPTPEQKGGLRFSLSHTFQKKILKNFSFELNLDEHSDFKISMHMGYFTDFINSTVRLREVL